MDKFKLTILLEALSATSNIKGLDLIYKLTELSEYIKREKITDSNIIDAFTNALKRVYK